MKAVRTHEYRIDGYGCRTVLKIGSDATLVHLRDLWHVCASAIASAGVFCKTLLSKAFR